MEKESKIGMGQLVALLLTSRLAVTLTYSPTRHQASHGTDFFLSILLHMLLMAVLILPVWWFSHRTQGAGTLDYAYILFRRGGAVVTVLYIIACLYVLILGLLRFNHFVSTTLSPDMPRITLCIVIAVTAFVAAFFGLQAIARAALLIAALVVLCVVLIAIAMIPELDASCFPPCLLYTSIQFAERPQEEEIYRRIIQRIVHIGAALDQACVTIEKSILKRNCPMTIPMQIKCIGIQDTDGQAEHKGK